MYPVNIVSGCPRSGTSVMMDIHRRALGDDCIIYSSNIDAEKQPKLNPYQRWLMDNTVAGKKQKAKRDHIKDMNPHGFYECAFSVKGMSYSTEHHQLYQRIKDNDYPVVKIVSQGLTNTAPSEVSRVVYMLRHPREVAKSQEKLMRSMMVMDQLGAKRDVFEGMKIHTPKMFISTTIAACQWFTLNPQVPVEIVLFEDLFENKAKVSQQLQGFHGRGDFAEGMNAVDGELRRSEPEDIPSRLWEEAEEIYALMLEHRFAEVWKKHGRMDTEAARDSRRFHCARRGAATVEAQCKMCMGDSATRNTFREQATKKGVKWKDNPCAYQCGFGRGESMSVDESIADNFWNHDDALASIE